MSPRDFALRSRRVLTPEGISPACVHVRDGAIQHVGSWEDVPRSVALEDAGEYVVFPGLVDTHVHINEPGRADWEGLETATRAAAAGGITTLIEMPLNGIPSTTSAAALREKVAAATGKLHVDVGFWGGVVPGNTRELVPLYDAGVFGFKCFLVPSGVEEFPHVTEFDLREALPVVSQLDAPLLAHAELPGPIDDAVARLSPGDSDPTRYATWLRSRPRAAENEAIALLLRLAREFRVRVHIVHLSSSDVIPLLRQAKRGGVPISVETCHHYLAFGAEQIPDGATEFKCAPPIREKENCEKLWAALEEGLIDFVATDHSPAPAASKCRDTGDFLRAWGGIASLQLSLPVLWTHMHARKIPLQRLGAWLGAGPARLAGLENRKGRIAVGYDADLVVWDPEAAWRVDATQLHHRHKLTPYDGRELRGRVARTWVRGQLVYDSGEFPADAAGRVLRRTSA